MYVNIFIIIFSVLLIILWGYASTVKLLDLKKFSYALTLQVFPKWMGRILAWVLPTSELIITFLLFFSRTRLLGMYLSFILLAIFTLYVGGVVYKVYDSYPCPCGGLFRRLGWKKHFKLNLLLTIISLAGIILMEFAEK